jgi:hypothetical protein
VINFSNGKFVTGYPVQLGTFAGVTPTATFTGNQWGVGNGSSYMTWSAVLAAVGNPTAVTSAFIVADSGFAGEFDTVISNGEYNGQPLSCAAASSSPSPSASASPTPSPSHSPFPVGGVQTGGGKPGTSLWLPFGAGLAGLAVLSLAAAMITRRRQRQRS